MAFPVSPTIGDYHSEGDVWWEWSGVGWRQVIPTIIRGRDSGSVEWDYRPDPTGRLHQWPRLQPPVTLAGGSGQDIVTGANVQVPQANFAARWLVNAADYSVGDYGLGGQYVTSGATRAWAVRLTSTGQFTIYVSADGTNGLTSTTTANVYRAGVVDAQRAAIAAAFVLTGSSILVHLSACRFDPGRPLAIQPFRFLQTSTFAIAGLVNTSTRVHIGSRFRVGTAAADGREGLAAIVEAMELEVNGSITARFPKPVGSETWTTTGTPVSSPAALGDSATPSEPPIPLLTVTGYTATLPPGTKIAANMPALSSLAATYTPGPLGSRVLVAHGARVTTFESRAVAGSYDWVEIG